MVFALELTQSLLLFVTALITIWTLMKWLEFRKLPPGPFGLPIVGYMPFLIKNPHKVLMEFGKKYGNIFSVNMGISRCIILNDCDSLKQILNHPAVVARPEQTSHLFPGGGGFGNTNGDKWHEQRRFCVTAMKNLGLGRGEWETMIHDETVEFTEEIKSWDGKPKDFFKPLEMSVAGNILSLLIGRRLPRDENSPEMKILSDFLHSTMTEVNPSAFIVHIPEWVLNFLRRLGVEYIEKFFKNKEDFEELLRKEIQDNMNSPNETEIPTFIKFYLNEMKDKENGDKKHHFSVFSLIGNIGILFLGGVDTTTLSLHWLLLLIASHPEVQQKIHQEIDDVAGKDRHIYWDERHNFPYIMATINEMERWVTLTPLFPVRCALEDVKVGDYTIPKDSFVIVNGWALTRDQRYHRDADQFEPERFLNSESKQPQKLESYFPFSWGKRNCPGEQVAMMTMFLYFTAIMQKFRVVCPENKSVQLQDEGKGLTRHAVLQELCFVER